MSGINSIRRVEILSSRDVRGQKARIVRDGGLFRLVDEEGYPVAESAWPSRLSDLALGIGAESVTHDYEVDHTDDY